MRFIDLHRTGGPKLKDGTTPNKAWLEKAANLLKELADAPDKTARDALIDRDASAKFWGELREWLLTLSHDKCWYSEARDVFSVLEVEHYRPKKSCKRAPRTKPGDGYWWLAFEWSNYRLCGKLGNGKKGDFFPLKEGSLVAAREGLSVDNEFPLLLDPACAADADLLSFNEDGSCGPHADADSYEKLRVDTTSHRLNLNHGRVRRARVKVWTQCRALIDQCRELCTKIGAAPGPAELERLKQHKSRLREMVRPEAEFSAVAKNCLLKSGIGWAQSLATG